MLDLGAIGLFAGLSMESLERLRRTVEHRPYPTGSILCRRGEEGRAVFAIAGGGVAVELGDASSPVARRVFLGPGEVFGEMSILSGRPISATVVAIQQTDVYVIRRELFLELLDSEAQMQAALSRMLVNRIRDRTGRQSEGGRAGWALLVMTEPSPLLRDLALTVFRGVRHYAPASQLVTAGPSPVDAVRDSPPAPVPAGGFPTSDSAPVPIPHESGAWHLRDGRDPGWFRELARRWRDTAPTSQYLLTSVDLDTASRLYALLEEGDVVVVFEKRAGVCVSLGPELATIGLADRGVVCLGSDEPDRRPDDGIWRFITTPVELRAALADPSWRRDDRPTLDWVARWVTRREVGFALGAGAARAFAHLGVLEVLEAEGVPIDCLSGTSMGGIVALSYARMGTTRDTIELMERTVGSNRKVRDLRLIPRSSLFAGERARTAARTAAAGLDIAQLRRPAFVTAADLAHSELFVIDRGPVERAYLATSAIPGMFPPIVEGGRILVDGALVNRIPVELLGRRRCGLKIAVNVVPAPQQDTAEQRSRATALQESAGRVLGLRQIIASSWELLGWWQGASDAAPADILIEAQTRLSGYDFDRFSQMVECGREAARRNLDSIRAAIFAMLSPNSG